MKVIGLCGLAGSGKDYIHQRLEALFAPDLYVERIALADILRHELEEALNDGNTLRSLWSKPYPEPVRWLLQQWGTEYRRGQNPNYWIDRAAELIRVSEADLVVVTDVRFKNEAMMIRRHGGIVVEVTASEQARRARLGGLLPPAHSSEVIDFAPNAWIRNNTEPLADDGVIAYLGLDGGCVHCRSLVRHPFHSNGDQAFDVDFGSPSVHLETETA